MRTASCWGEAFVATWRAASRVPSLTNMACRVAIDGGRFMIKTIDPHNWEA